MDQAGIDHWLMDRAIELARRGEGCVEPNPLVGCVIARGAEIVGEGWHRRYGGPHAEIEALALAGSAAAGATLYVTLEPCCHQGKTPPCSNAVIAAGIRRVVAAQRDPFPQVAGQGFAQLREAGIEVISGVCEAAAQQLNAPYLHLLQTGRPWVMAKWAMTLDGKLATHQGDSRWISGEAAREIVHALRGRVDAVLVGIGTALADDPLLTARPSGSRVAARVVLDRQARLPLSSQLVQSVDQGPVLVVVGPSADAPRAAQLQAAGCEVLQLETDDQQQGLRQVWTHLGQRRMTNVLVEGGSQVLGALQDGAWINEVHAFIAPVLAGGQAAFSPMAGDGAAKIAHATRLERVSIRTLESDVYVHGFVGKP